MLCIIAGVMPTNTVLQTVHGRLSPTDDAALQTWLRECRCRLSSIDTVASKLEATAVVLAQNIAATTTLPGKDSVAFQVPRSEVASLVEQLMGVMLQAGQQTGEVRSDVSIDELTCWMLDEITFMASQGNVDDQRVVRRFRTFLLPGLNPTVLGSNSPSPHRPTET